MRIALDAMGSDRAPAPDVEGAVRAARRYGYEILLVGRPADLEPQLARHAASDLLVSIVPASQVITMDDHPGSAVREKPDSSMVVAMGLVRDGKADAYVSAGNSGGTLAAALASVSRLGRIHGIRRPALTTVLPTAAGQRSLLLDIGANTDCRPEWLVQFAVMGAVYVHSVMGIESPRVALLSNGEEETKGNNAVRAAHAALEQLPKLRFVGSVEGKDLLTGAVDVIVADGFVGNVALKTAEGMANLLMDLLRAEIKAGVVTSLGGLLAKPAFHRIGKMLDYREYGGAPLLGVNGAVIIAHGRSDALAVESAIRVAAEAVNGGVVERIREGVELLGVGDDGPDAPDA